MDWITKNIAIGNFIDAKKVTKNDVDALLCSKPECCNDENEKIDVFCLPLIDGAGNDKIFLKDAVDFIDDVVSNNERILVHCHAGRSRSVCIVALYFMLIHGMPSHQALKKIKF